MILLPEHAPEALEAAKECLQRGGVLALPTETVYGLVVRWDSAQARERLYAMKHRPASKRLQMMAPTLEAAVKAGVRPGAALETLARRFWPGPLTLVVPDRSGDDTIGLRIPRHPFLLRLMEETGLVCAATSANLSGAPPATTLRDGLKDLATPPDLALDGGVITVTDGAASTVVSLITNPPTLLRQGTISLSEVLLALP
ncbi:MAG: L-threonylcarbamoyladenylate synthase [Oligosphaeraceae bacterium]